MTESMDVIFYQQHTTRPHQDHIILHEIGHLVADHPSDEGDDQAWGSLEPGERPGGATRALRRTCYDSAHEREAELIATYILQWASVLNPLYPAGAEPLGSSLSHHQGWL
ncbi:hypothetical protein GCM10020358_28590 [Amorphoplanes nipponensis]